MGFYRQLVRVCEGELEGGVRELGSGVSTTSNEKAFHIICVLTAATDMMVWASQEDAGEGGACCHSDNDMNHHFHLPSLRG